MKRKLTEAAALILALAILIGGSIYLSDTLIPERTSYGAGWNMFRTEERDSVDVMFFGSSFVYCDVIPAVIYERTGRTSYVMAAPVCTMATAYYYIKEALRTQSPAEIFLEVSSIFFEEYSPYADVALGYMPWSGNRLAAIFTSAAPESRLGLLFPLYNYHNRWKETPLADYFGRGDRKPDPWAGYMPMAGSTPIEEIETLSVDLEKISFDKNCRYFNKIVSLCREEGIDLVCFLSPSCSPYGEEEQSLLREVMGDTALVDLNDAAEEMGLDPMTDYYDARHLNIFGARKMSAYIADIYGEEWSGLPNRDFDAELWDERVLSIEEFVQSSGK